jgi:hypothetical protein
VDAGIAVVAGIGVARGVMGEAQQESAFDLGDLLADRVGDAHAVELSCLAAGIDLLVRAPGHGLGMIEHMPQVGECQQIPRFRHGFPRRPPRLDRRFRRQHSDVQDHRTKPRMPENGVDRERRTQRNVAPCEAE